MGGSQKGLIHTPNLFDCHAHRVAVYIDQSPHVGSDLVRVLEPGPARTNVVLYK